MRGKTGRPIFSKSHMLLDAGVKVGVRAPYVGPNGELIFGAGAVILDSNGITLKGNMIAIQDSNGVLRGAIYGHTGAYLLIFGNEAIYLSGPITINSDLTTTAPNARDIGDATNYFAQMHTKELRLNAYTIATKPAAGVAGRIVFVSDEAAGQKFQGDDGAAWVYLG